MPKRNVLVVVNPVAGRGRGESAAGELADVLRSRGTVVETYATRARGDARDRVAAIEREHDAIVSVGGDGTLGEVLSGLRDRAIPVAQLALGTANVLALDLRLPRDPAHLAYVVLAGRTQPMDVARIGERFSFLGASAGYDARVVHALEKLRRGPITKWTWARAARAELATYEPPALSVEVDGRAIDGTFGMVLVANVVNYAGWPSLARDTRRDDGRFDAYLFPACSRPGLLRHAARGVFARFPGGGVQRVSGRRFCVTSAQPEPVQVDGDAAGTTPFELAVEAEPVRILVP